MRKQSKDNEALDAHIHHCLIGDILMLRYVGLVSMGNIFKREEPKWSPWEGVPFWIGLVTLTLPWSGELRLIHRTLKVDPLLAIQDGAVILLDPLIIFKGIRLWFYRRDLYNILDICHSRWKLHVSRNSITQNEVKITEHRRVFRNYYAVTVFFATSCYVLRAYGPYAKYYLYDYFHHSNVTFDYTQTIFPAAYPFELNSDRRFLMTTLFETSGCYAFYAWWTITDCLFVQITTHVALNWKLLSDDLRRINFNDNAAIVMNKLKGIVEEQKQIYQLAHLTEKYYNPIIFTTIFINSVDLCLSLYNMQYKLDEHNWKGVIKNVIFTMAVTLQTLIFCNYAQKISDQVAQFRRTVFDCPWTDCGNEVRKFMLIIMTYSIKEYTYTAYGFIYLNMPQMTQIFTAAVRYFTLLRNIT